MKQALHLSLVQEPNVLAQAIETQRTQLRDHLHIADTAREQEDLETWARAARNAADVSKALAENLEMQMRSRATVHEAATLSLVEELKRRALKENDKEAQAALKIPVAKKKGGARAGR